MWLKSTNPAHQGTADGSRIRLPAMDSPAELTSNGKFQVPDDVGEELIDAYDDIEGAGEPDEAADTDEPTDETDSEGDTE